MTSRDLMRAEAKKALEAKGGKSSGKDRRDDKDRKAKGRDRSRDRRRRSRSNKRRSRSRSRSRRRSRERRSRSRSAKPAALEDVRRSEERPSGKDKEVEVVEPEPEGGEDEESCVI